jgi:hypothetical protein
MDRRLTALLITGVVALGSAGCSDGGTTSDRSTGTASSSSATATPSATSTTAAPALPTLTDSGPGGRHARRSCVGGADGSRR